MKLICEIIENDNLSCISEVNESTGQKNHYISGIFLQSNIKNKNGRIYPEAVLSKEVTRYVTEYVDKGRAYGELGHPQGPLINLERVSHMIKELKQDGTNWIGKAKIMDTPYGKIVKSFIDEGCTLGVSSRGMGSLKRVNEIDEVQNDYYLATAADIVADPSAPDAFVSGIMEGKEWVWDNGILREEQIADIAEVIETAPVKTVAEAQAVEFAAFERYMTELSSHTLRSYVRKVKTEFAGGPSAKGAKRVMGIRKAEKKLDDLSYRNARRSVGLGK